MTWSISFSRSQLGSSGSSSPLHKPLDGGGKGRRRGFWEPLVEKVGLKSWPCLDCWAASSEVPALSLDPRKSPLS